MNFNKVHGMDKERKVNLYCMARGIKGWFESCGEMFEAEFVQVEKLGSPVLH